MATGIKESVSNLAKEFAKLYKELVTNTAQFEELRKYTKETLDSFKNSLVRVQDKLENYESLSSFFVPERIGLALFFPHRKKSKAPVLFLATGFLNFFLSTIN